MKKTLIIIGCSLVAILILGAGAGAYWWFTKPQVIELGSGATLSLLDVTYGKHHKLSKAKAGGRAPRGGGTVTTPNDSVCFWIEQKHEQNNWPNYQVLLYDSAGTACAAEYTRTYGNFGNQQGDEVMGFVFTAFPHQSGRLRLHIEEWNNQGGGQDDIGYFSAHNPAPSKDYAKWTPEKLPVSKEDGDLQVTLTRYEVDSETFGRSGGDAKPDDPRLKGILAAFHIEQAGILVTNWQPVQVATSDASGNTTGNRGLVNRSDKDEQDMIYQYGLWPNEPAWKIRVEMSRQSGFNQDEIWTVSDIPLTNVTDMNQIWNPNMKKTKPFAETKLGESQVQIYPISKLSDEQQRSYGDMEAILRIHVKPLPDGTRMTIMKVTDEKNNAIDFSNWGGGGNDVRYQLKNMGDPKTLNVTLAVHRSRFVEFTVKPTQK